ncbi:hypothetical protein HFO17_18895 [Rhizobium laguerreae]|uniref:hypothetical protein n=1 Tax=Rhizobium laguerreae TaxID=1076926 RepID=UPI001C91B902|nr:hypothetical protein [Rhizobium laguerreae]MBY3236583.1 hypothetical protein [Rhizobium laguerreae]
MVVEAEGCRKSRTGSQGQAMKQAFDLSAAAASLANNPAAKGLVGAIRRFDAITSVRVDLQTVREAVDALKGLLQSDEEDVSLTGLALLTTAVITYARATDTNSKSRFRVGIDGAFDGGVKDVHKGIIKLRDNVIAHFGPGDNWNDERIVWYSDDDGFAFTAVHRRVNFMAKTIFALDLLCLLALPYAKELEITRAKDLDDALVEMSPEIEAVVMKHPFDPDAFYGSTSEASKHFWNRGSLRERRFE